MPSCRHKTPYAWALDRIEHFEIRGVKLSRLAKMRSHWGMQKRVVLAKYSLTCAPTNQE